DVSGTAAIAGTKITPSFGAQNILTTGTLSSGAITATNLASINAVPYTWPNAQGVANTVLTNNGSGVLTWAPPSGGVTGLTDLSDANITSPLAGHMLVYDNTTSEFRNRALSGDIGTVSNLGAVTLANDAVNSLKISNGAIVDVDVSASAAIAGTKISPSFGTQNIVTTGTLSSGAITATNLASIAGVTYAWPTTQGVASTVLTNDGSGTLTWGTLPATFNTLNQVPRGNGTTLVSSNIYSDGTNVGIGATAPRSILELQNGNLILSGSTALPNDPVDIDFKTLTDVFKAKIWTDPSSNTLWISTHTSPTANKYLTLDPNGRFGISSTTPANLLDVEGSVAIGAAYSGTTAAPTNGMIVEGNVGIGTNAPGTSALNVNVAGGVANPDALTVVNAYNGASTKTGISTSVTLDGTGQRYGIENSVNGNSGSGSNVFGVSNLIAPNGSGSTFGTYNNISSVGTGSRFGTYNYVNATASNTSSIYGNYTYVGNSGSGIQYGHNAYITSLGSGKKYGSYLTVYGTSGSASNIYGTYNSFYPNGTGDAFGTFNFIRVNGTGNRYGTYDSVLASASNNQAIYAMYAYTDHAGSGASYGVRVDANKPSGASGSVFGIYNLTNNAGTGTTYGMYVDANKPSGIAGTLYGLYVTSDNDGTSNSYVVRGSSIGSTTATEYGIYISGEDENYLQGSLGVGRLVTTNKLEVNGEASKTTAGGWIANSDRRIKTDIHSIDNALQTIRSLRPVKFKYTDYWLAKNPSIKDRYYYNFIAQEYQQVFPDAVKGSGEYIEGDTKEILQIDTYDAGIVTIRAIQELAEKVEQLEKENAQLKAEKTTVENELRAEIAEIKKMLGTEAKASKKEK
ncbi:MAG: tail fiber domain-containing protein, partial [Bacteroidota bacterium]